MGRSPCCDKNGLKKGPWTPEEDELLIQYIHTHGPGNWRTLPKIAGLQRSGKSCRLRWTNYLRPDIKRGRFSFEEEESIIQLHSILGNKWSAIAARLPGRTDNEIKNYWNTHIRKRLLKMGMDPVTHSPGLDVLDQSSILRTSQINCSSLLGLQTLLNSALARLFTTLLTSNHQNLNTHSQNVKQNQLTINNEMQNQFPTNFRSNIQCASSSIQTTSNTNQIQWMDFMTCQSYQPNLLPSNLDESFGILENNFPNECDQINLDQSKNPNFPSTNCSLVTCENVLFESFLSTPMPSPTPVNSSTTFINNGNTSYDREIYYNDAFKFEIPEGLDLDDFM